MGNTASQHVEVVTPRRRSGRVSEIVDANNIAVPLGEGQSLRNADPEQVLERILEEIKHPKSRHHKRYRAFMDSEGEKIENLMKRCVRRETWDFIESGWRERDISRMKQIGGDLTSHGRTIYLHIIPFTNSTHRFYIGQAKNFAYRIHKQHADFRYRRDHPSLHYYAMDRSAPGDTYVVLATLWEKCEEPDLVLNLLECWMVLVFGTAQGATMHEWLGWSGEGGGLDVAIPLDSGDDMASRRAFGLLRYENDDMVKKYFWDTRNGNLRPKPDANAGLQGAKRFGKERLVPFLTGAGIASVLWGLWASRFVRKLERRK